MVADLRTIAIGERCCGSGPSAEPPRRPHIVTNQSQANEDVWSRQGDHSPRTWAAAATPSSTFSKAAAGRARTGWFASRTAQASPSAPSSGTPSADCCGLVSTRCLGGGRVRVVLLPRASHFSRWEKAESSRFATSGIWC
jgi:hypothetical protein